jgi:hypothetical protein
MKNNILIVLAVIALAFVGWRVLQIRDGATNPVVQPVIPSPAPQQVIIQQVEQIVTIATPVIQVIELPAPTEPATIAPEGNRGGWAAPTPAGEMGGRDMTGDKHKRTP